MKDKILYNIQSYRHGTPIWNMNNYYDVKMPERIDIGLTDACNEKCFMCPNPLLPNPRGYMDEELFYKIIDEAHGLGMRGVGLGLFGEPTMHNRFMDFIKYINNKEMEFYCSTNAVTLSNKISDYLINNSKGRLHLSLYSTSEKSFEEVHGINAKGYNLVVENIEYLIDGLSKKKNSELLIFMNYLETKKDEGGYELWLKKWLPQLKKVNHLDSTKKPYVTWMGRVEDVEPDKEKSGYIT